MKKKKRRIQSVSSLSSASDDEPPKAPSASGSSHSTPPRPKPHLRWRQGTASLRKSITSPHAKLARSPSAASDSSSSAVGLVYLKGHER